GTAGVVNADRFVHFDLAGHRFGRRERGLAKRNTNVGMNFAGDANFTALWKAVGDAASVPTIIRWEAGSFPYRRIGHDSACLSLFVRTILLRMHSCPSWLTKQKSHARKNAWLRYWQSAFGPR